MALLVGWYALYQAFHIILNTVYLIGLAPWFPPPPSGGWHAQARYFLGGMAFLDLINAFLTLFFAWGYFQRKKWSLSVGIITLTVSLYAALLFTIGTVQSGAWTGNLLGYLSFYLPFLPIVYLYYLVIKVAMT